MATCCAGVGLEWARDDRSFLCVPVVHSSAVGEDALNAAPKQYSLSEMLKRELIRTRNHGLEKMWEKCEDIPHPMERMVGTWGLEPQTSTVSRFA